MEQHRKIGIVGVRKGNVHFFLPLFFHNIAMTVQYLIKLMKHINQSLMFSDIVCTSQTSICDNVHVISLDQNDFQALINCISLSLPFSVYSFLALFFLV